YLAWQEQQRAISILGAIEFLRTKTLYPEAQDISQPPRLIAEGAADGQGFIVRLGRCYVIFLVEIVQAEIQSHLRIAEERRQGFQLKLQALTDTVPQRGEDPWDRGERQKRNIQRTVQFMDRIRCRPTVQHAFLSPTQTCPGAAQIQKHQEDAH